MNRDPTPFVDPLLARADMGGNIAAAAFILAMGVLVLWTVSPRSRRSKPRWGLAVVALVGGPIVGLFWFIADIFVIQPYAYLVPQDYIDTLLPVLTIGCIGGVVGAAAISVAECVRYRVSLKLAETSPGETDGIG